ncbi:MAG: bile acid:sodium symporter family protein [bacterium]|nr:bile acid:sodium symporter family protein [bacterium]
MLDTLFSNIDILIDLVLAFITMSLGLILTKQDFKQLFVMPKSLTVGLFAQMILLPIAAFILMKFTDFSPAIKVGFIIISVCPGGVTSNLVSYLLKGNVALSISLTVMNGLLCMFTIPIFVNLGIGYYFHHTTLIELPVWNAIQHIALVTVFPATIGVLIRNKFARLANKIQPILKYLLPTLLLIIFMVKIFVPADKGGIALSSSEILTLSIWVLLQNLSGILLGYLTGYLFRLDFQNKITIIIEVGLHNTALALLIAGNLLRNNEMQKPIMVYAMFTFFSTLLFTWLIKTLAIRIIEKRKTIEV